METELRKYYETLFGDSSGAVYEKQPSSLIIFGDHTHYNDGILISYILDKHWQIILKKRKDTTINFSIYGSGAFTQISLNTLNDESNSQFRILSGLTQILFDNDLIKNGFDCVLYKDIPICTGLGYFSSQQICFIKALSRALSVKLSDEQILNFVRINELAKIGKISNQAHHYSVLFGKENKFFITDLRSKEYKIISSPFSKHDLLIIDTNEKLNDPVRTCNERIDECEVGVKGLRLYIWGIKNLRDVQLDFLLKHVHMLPKKIFNRILFNVHERLRTESAIDKIKKKDAGAIGELLNASHSDLTTEYELICEKCNFIQEKLIQMEGVLGSKMICCTPVRSSFAIVENSESVSASKYLSASFKQKYSDEIQIYKVSLVNSKKETKERATGVVQAL